MDKEKRMDEWRNEREEEEKRGRKKRKKRNEEGYSMERRKRGMRIDSKRSET